MKKTSYKIFTLGCKVNQYDAGRIAQKLKLAGVREKEDGFDVAIIYSCAVTEKAINKCLRLISKLRSGNPRTKIIVTGCLAETNVDKIKALAPDKIYKISEQEDLFFYVGGQRDKLEKSCLTSQFSRSRYFLKVQDGCNQFCSYCVIPHARGKLQSRDVDSILIEAGGAASAGFAEIVLTGIHLGRYGQDLSNKIDLSGLVEKIIKIKDVGRIRMSSIEVSEIDDKLIKMIREEKKICRHLHIPLQSGSSKVLKRMNRPYTLSEYRKKIRKIRKEIPLIAITTDIIVGFPGETEADFKITKKAVEEFNFSRLHVFPFSAHEQVPAAKFGNKIKEETKKKRARELREIGYKLSRQEKKRLLADDLEVVIEQIFDEKIKGKTEFYFDIFFSKKDISCGICRKGGLVKVKNS